MNFCKPLSLTYYSFWTISFFQWNECFWQRITFNLSAFDYLFQNYDHESVPIGWGKKGKQLALAFIYFRQNVHVRFAAMLCIPSFFHWKHGNTCNLQAYWSRGYHGKVEKKILKGSLDSIPSPSSSVKIQIMSGKFCLRCKGKTLLTFESKMFVDITQQCFALFPQVNFPANNLNFHWRWGWWNQI